MGRSVVVLALMAALTVALLLGAQASRTAEASFHFVRIHAVAAGMFQNGDVQYVELRMASGGQTEVEGAVLCFFDRDGEPWSRFTFQSDHAVTSVTGSSILVGTPAMDSVWPHAPDEVFHIDTVTGIGNGVPLTAPIPIGAGKAAFGTDDATEASEMCAAGFAVIDSVAYGATYTGPVDFGTKFATELPTGNAQVLRLTGPLCSACAKDNSIDYSLADSNVAANNPRNNKGESAALGNPPGVQGDANCDSVVDEEDGLAALFDAANMGSPACASLGDVNCDQAHGTDDALEIFRYVAGSGRVTPAPGGCADINNTVVAP